MPLTLRKFAKKFHEERTECAPDLPVYLHVRDGERGVYYTVSDITVSVHSPTSAAMVIEAGEISSVG